jgi:Tol biopolymer transport system component
LEPSRISLINPDGSQDQVVADPAVTAPDDSFTAPTWSPDGERLLFAVAKINDAGFPPIRSFLGVIDSPGGRVRDLLAGDYSWYPHASQLPPDGRGWDPDWSPDEKRIVFTAYDGVSVLTLRTHRLQPLAANGYRPRWSSDGRRIVFVRRDPGLPNESIFVMKADGSHARQLAP